MKQVTLDTNTLPADDLLSPGQDLGYQFALISVSRRELEGTSFEVELKKVDQLPETAVWNESRWGEALLAGESQEDLLEEILRVIGSGSFPKDRSSLSVNQLHQLRDAMIFEAHCREGRDILVSGDKRAFVKHGRRRALEALCDTRILTRAEFADMLTQKRG